MESPRATEPLALMEPHRAMDSAIQQETGMNPPIHGLCAFREFEALGAGGAANSNAGPTMS